MCPRLPTRPGIHFTHRGAVKFRVHRCNSLPFNEPLRENTTTPGHRLLLTVSNLRSSFLFSSLHLFPSSLWIVYTIAIATSSFLFVTVSRSPGFLQRDCNWRFVCWRREWRLVSITRFYPRVVQCARFSFKPAILIWQD